MESTATTLRTYTCRELCQPEIFEDLYGTYSRKLYRYAYYHLNSNQKATVRSITALLYRIMHNLIVDQYRARKPASSVEEMLEVGIEIKDIKALDASKKAEFSLVLEGIEKLEEADRNLLLLRFIEDLPVTDIADMHGITENNASVRIHRALNKLKNIVNAQYAK